MPAATSTQMVVDDTLRGTGWEVEHHGLASLTLSRCRACFGCWVVDPGVCVRGDDAARCAARAIGSDLLVLLTPIVFGGFSSRLKSVIDRMMGIVMPFQKKLGAVSHHPRRYRRTPILVGIGLLQEPCPAWEGTFVDLVERLAVDFQSPERAALIVVGDRPDARVAESVSAVVRQAGDHR